MKTAAIVVLLSGLAIACLAQNHKADQEFYEELYNAGQLDRLAALHVCYVEGLNQPAFLTFAESGPMRARMESNGQLKGLPEEDKKLFDQDILWLRLYVKGRESSSEREVMSREDGIWVRHLPDQNGHTTRILFTFDEKTSRFWYGDGDKTLPAGSGRPTQVQAQPEIRDIGSAEEAIGNFGHCEAIPNRVKQHGSEN
jgi:hypothetical protein